MIINRNSLAFHIACLLVLKILCIFIIWKWFFSEPLSMDERKEGLGAQIYSVKPSN